MHEPDLRALETLLGGTVTDVAPMLGGASSEIWSLSQGGRRLVLRRDHAGTSRPSTLLLEAALLRAAAAANVPVPAVVAVRDGPAPWLVMERLDGETLGRRVLREDAFREARRALTAQCARALALLHRGVDPDGIRGLPDHPDPLAALRAMLEPTGEPHPAFELAFARLAAEPPPLRLPRATVHGDFRLGNFVVDRRGLAGVLDWELAHAGDPAEDLGWLCVRSWRFGGALPVGGFGTREELLTEYRSAGGATIDDATLAWWEAYGTLRWGIICVMQAARHLQGEVRSVELAAIGRRVCEVEYDLLALLYGPQPEASPEPAASTLPSPHDRPQADELLTAVAEWIATLSLDPRNTYLARVSVRALDIARRELRYAAPLSAAHAERLAALRVADDAALAAKIRAGDRSERVVELVRASVVDKLRVADPAHLRADDAERPVPA